MLTWVNDVGVRRLDERMTIKVSGLRFVVIQHKSIVTA